jgi:hypothetical protein
VIQLVCPDCGRTATEVFDRFQLFRPCDDSQGLTTTKPFNGAQFMDPTTYYITILEAIREHDYQRAREYALILRGWLESGGFYPRDFAANNILETLGRLLRPACNPSSLRFSFSGLVCIHCDAGADIDSLEEAIDQGWTKIDPEVDVPNAPHCGLCPACRIKQYQDIY